MEYKKLFDAEYKVMQIVWDNEPFGSRELAEICFKELGWKKSTTYTMLKRLIEKGYTKNDNATVTSLISREEVQKRESKDFVDKKCKRNMTKVLTILSFVNENDDGSEGSPLMLALNEIEKFRQLLIYKYQEHLSKKEYREYLKKLEILTSEIKLRLSVLKEEEMLDYGRRGGR